jgi:hypothetical protein
MMVGEEMVRTTVGEEPEARETRTGYGVCACWQRTQGVDWRGEDGSGMTVLWAVEYRLPLRITHGLGALWPRCVWQQRDG